MHLASHKRAVLSLSTRHLCSLCFSVYVSQHTAVGQWHVLYIYLPHCAVRSSNQRRFRQPKICSLRLYAADWTIYETMPSQSPQSSTPRQLHARSKHPNRKNFDQDANIHNFAPVARIMKTALPENAKIAKEAKECMQECVSEFISFITSEGKLSILPSAARKGHSHH